jgi:hypothetical protein
MKQVKLVSPKSIAPRSFTWRRMRKLRFLICYLDALRQASTVAWFDEKAGSYHATCQLCWLNEHGQRSAKQSAEIEVT